MVVVTIIFMELTLTGNSKPINLTDDINRTEELKPMKDVMEIQESRYHGRHCHRHHWNSKHGFVFDCICICRF